MGKATQRGSVVITGASSGIGRSCALVLDSMGFRVFAGIRKEEDGRFLQTHGSTRLRSVLLDVTDDNEVATAARLVEKSTQDCPLIGLVNNAGVSTSGPVELTSRAEFRQLLDVNLVSQLAVTAAFLPLLRRNKGRIVNIGSTSGRIAEAFSGPYCASKFGLEALSAALRMELEPAGVKVSLIEPGVIATPFWDKLIRSQDEAVKSARQEPREFYAKRLDRRRAGLTECAKKGGSAEGVARAVARAFTARRPRDRYTIGFDARLRTAAAKILPHALRSMLADIKRGVAHAHHS